MHHKLIQFIFLVAIAIVTGAATARAEDNASAADDRDWAFSAILATFLPTQIAHVTEEMLGADFRVSVPTPKGLFEIDGFLANGSGCTYKTFSLDYRYDVGFPGVPAFVLVGFNFDIFTPHPPYDTYNFSAGWHFGGGFLQPLFGGWAVREDIRYRNGPGTSLLVGLGLSYQF